jgi:hypothetical protein
VVAFATIDPRVLSTVAVVYAAAGQRGLPHQTAIQAARGARDLGDAELAAEIASHVRAY